MGAVRVYHSGMNNAPQLSYVAGTFVSVLNACLVSGVPSTTASALTVSANVATLTTSVTHGYVAGQLITVSGCDNAALNGDKRVLTATANTLTYDATGVADGTATGIISFNVPGLGWTKHASSSSTKAAYQPVGGQWLWVDDSVTFASSAMAYAIVRGFETMTDPTATTPGTGQFPTSGQETTSYWLKTSGTTTPVNRPWWIIGNDQFMYVFVEINSSYAGIGTAWCFGNIQSYAATDSYKSIITMARSTTSLPGGQSWTFYQNANTARYVSRLCTGSGGSSPISMAGASGYAGGATLGAGGWLSYPQATDNSLVLHYPMLLLENNNATLRGHVPGLWGCTQSVGAYFNTLDVVKNINGGSGAVMAFAHSDSTSKYIVFIDHIGPW